MNPDLEKRVPREILAELIEEGTEAFRGILEKLFNVAMQLERSEFRTGQYENNRAEVSHQHTREQERQMRGFKSIEQAQRFLAVHGQVQNLFRVGRNHLKAVHHRLLRDRAFADWREATCAH